MSVEAWAIVSTVVLSFVGYLVTYALQRSQAHHDAQLSRVNQQLRELYGPLYTTLKANEAIWQEFQSKLWPAHGQPGYFGPGLTVTEEEKERWRLWMIEVFEPLNTRIEQAILENGDLLEGSQLPLIFVEALAHIAAYRALYPKWLAGDFSNQTSLIDYPAGLLSVVEPVYLRLLDRQKQLAGLKT